MLKKYFFIAPDSSKKTFLLLIALFFMGFEYLFLFVILYAAVLFLFRKKTIDQSMLRTVDEGILLSPVDGQLLEAKDKNLVFKISPFSHYGIRMPFFGHVRNYKETKVKKFQLGKLSLYRYDTELELKSKTFGKIKLRFSNLTSYTRVKVFVRSGDKATLGAYIGYLPFGGKVKVDLPENLKLLVDNKDKMQSAQTLIASQGNKYA